MNDATEIAQEKSVEKTVNMLLTVNESKVNESKVNESKVNESQRPMKNNDTHVELKSDKEEPQKQIIQWADTVPFTFPIVGGQVIKVYDGDTITIASKLPYPESPLYRLSVRLNGIDTPEIKGSNDDEKQAAKNARDAVSSIIMQKQIRLENVQSEKYGRILADVYYGDLHLNKWLIDNRYAVAYDGGTKIAPKSWLKYKETGEK
jgi:endonuclease YncB( thermonuclease family)